MATTNITQDFTCELIENEVLSVELSQIEVINNTKQFTESLEEYLILNEVPTKLNATTFQTANTFVANKIVVFYNGIKHKAITSLSATTFSFDFDTIADDTVEVMYIKSS